MSVDISKIKPGDELVIRVEVLSRNNGGLWVNCAGMHASNAMDATTAAIVSHTPKGLSVGDLVKVAGPRNVDVGEVVAVRGNHAWIDWPAPSCWADKIAFSELERVLERVA